MIIIEFHAKQGQQLVSSATACGMTDSWGNLTEINQELRQNIDKHSLDLLAVSAVRPKAKT